MSFAHPMMAWATAGLLLVAPLIHWLARRRAHPAPWAAMRFVIAAQEADRTRRRLNRWVLMMLRIAVLACVGLALARPSITGSALAVGTPQTHLILVIDDSLSMSAVYENPSSRFDQAIKMAKRLVADHHASAPISILTTSNRQPIVENAVDHRRAYDALEALDPTFMSTSITDAANRAAALVAQYPATAGHCVVLTDLAGDEWTHDDQQSPEAVESINQLANSIQTTVVRCAGDSVNYAIVSIVRAPRSLYRYPMIGIDVTIANYSHQGSEPVHVDLLDQQRIIRRIEAPVVFAGETGVVTAHIDASAIRSGVLTARLATARGDALAADDVRLFPVQAASAARALVITDQSGEFDLSATYLRHALAPAGRDGPAGYWAVTTSDSASLGSLVLGEYDLIVLSNVGTLAQSVWRQLERYVRAGGGLWCIPGDGTDFEHFNAFGFNGGQGVMAAPFRVADGIKQSQTQRIDITSLEQTPLNRLALFADASLFRAQISRYARIDSSNATVLVRLTNGDPLMVTRRLGLGRTALFATAADMAWSNLPAKGDFVSLVQEFADWMQRDGPSESSILIGQTYERRVSPTEATATVWVQGPDDAYPTVAIERREAHPVAVVKQVSRPGIYRVGAPAGQTTFVANVDPSESQLESAHVHDIGALLDDRVRLVAEPGAIDEPKEGGRESSVAMMLAHAGLLILVAESLMSVGMSRA